MTVVTTKELRRRQLNNAIKYCQHRQTDVEELADGIERGVARLVAASHQ